VGEGMGKRGRGPRLAETYAPQRLPGFAEEVGGGADDSLDRAEQEDEQGLREVVCERRGVGICCHDSPHDEAPCPHLRPFHTVSPRTSVNKLGHSSGFHCPQLSYPSSKKGGQYILCSNNIDKLGVGCRVVEASDGLQTEKGRKPCCDV
jgi:hypothetical protein